MSSHDSLGRVEEISQAGFLNQHRQCSMQDFTIKRHPCHEYGLDNEATPMVNLGVDMKNFYFWASTSGSDES